MKAIISAVLSTTETVYLVTIVLAGDWNNCAVHTTHAGDDCQALRTPVQWTDEEKTRRGVVGFMSFQYSVLDDTFSNETTELQPKSSPTKIPAVEDPKYEINLVNRCVGQQKTTIDNKTTQHQIVDALFEPIPQLLLKGDHPMTMVHLGENVYIAIFAMLGFGKGGFNIEPLYGMFLRKRFKSLLSAQITLSKNEFKKVAYTLKTEVTKKVCAYFNIPYSEYPFDKAEYQNIFKEIFLKQKDDLYKRLFDMIREFDSLPTE